MTGGVQSTISTVGHAVIYSS